jgi:predicted RNA-binding protein with RPS1 domain
MNNVNNNELQLPRATSPNTNNNQFKTKRKRGEWGSALPANLMTGSSNNPISPPNDSELPSANYAPFSAAANFFANYESKSSIGEPAHKPAAHFPSLPRLESNSSGAQAPLYDESMVPNNNYANNSNSNKSSTTHTIAQSLRSFTPQPADSATPPSDTQLINSTAAASAVLSAPAAAHPSTKHQQLSPKQTASIERYVAKASRKPEPRHHRSRSRSRSRSPRYRRRSRSYSRSRSRSPRYMDRYERRERENRDKYGERERYSRSSRRSRSRTRSRTRSRSKDRYNHQERERHRSPRRYYRSRSRSPLRSPRSKSPTQDRNDRSRYQRSKESLARPISKLPADSPPPLEPEVPKFAPLWSIQRAKVTNIQPFGLFVDILGDFDRKKGLVHNSKISSVRSVQNAVQEEVAEIGDEVWVKVIEVDPATYKTGLSMRDVEQSTGQDLDPTNANYRGNNTRNRSNNNNTAASEPAVLNSIHKARVTKLESFGAMSQLLDTHHYGLIHLSQLALYHVKSADEVVAQGDEVWVKIVAIQPESNKLSLSMKYVNQSTGIDLDPDQQQQAQDQQKKNKTNPETGSRTGLNNNKIELDAVYNADCTRCGGRGHLADGCFNAPGTNYSTLPPENSSSSAEPLTLATLSNDSVQSARIVEALRLIADAKKSKHSKKEKKSKKKSKKHKKDKKKSSKSSKKRSKRDENSESSTGSESETTPNK